MKTRWIISALCMLFLLSAQSWSKGSYKDLVKNIPYEQLDELKVKIEIGVANLMLEQVQGEGLFEARIHYKASRGEPRISFDRSGKVGYLTIESPESCDENEHEFEGLKGLSAGDERWELRFSTRIPVSFEMDLGLVDGTLDMSGLQVNRLSVSSGLSDLELSFNEPNLATMDELRLEVGLGELKANGLGNANFQRLRLEGGLGSATLDLSGSWRLPRAEMQVEVGLGSATLRVPQAVGIELLAEDNFLSSFDLARDIYEIESGTHRSSNWEQAAHKLTIEAQVGLGSLKVKRAD